MSTIPGGSGQDQERRASELLPGELVRRDKPGHVYVRIRREKLGSFRRSGRGYLVATE